MAIRSVESTLPDRDYIRALEAELREIRALLAQAQADIAALRKA